MDDQPVPRMDFGDWFLRWLDLVGECEKARGRMIDDDINVAVMLKRSPKELGDHRVLESPQLANMEFKFLVMRELVPVTKSLLSSETANGSCRGQYCCERFGCDSVCSWLAWIFARKKDTVKERAERKVRGKEKAKVRRKEKRKARERATAGKEREIGGTSNMIRGGWNRSVVTVVTVVNGSQEGPVPSMAGASSDGTWCNGVTSFTDCCFGPWILCVATCSGSEFFPCLTCLLVRIC